MISLIAAMADDRVIGFEGKMPWHLPADLRHFKTVTLGKPILMGRSTYESIGRPLPGRQNVVLSSRADLSIPGCDVYASLETALKAVPETQELMVIGGETLYRQCLPFASRLYLTFIEGSFSGDTFFPEWSSDEWQEISRESGEDNGLTYAFVTLDKVGAKS